MKIYYKKECEDCSTLMENEVLNKILTELREVLQVPEKKDIIPYARKIMKELDNKP